MSLYFLLWCGDPKSCPSVVVLYVFFLLFLTEGYQGRLRNKAWTFQKSSCIDLTRGVFAALYLVAIYDLEPE